MRSWLTPLGPYRFVLAAMVSKCLPKRLAILLNAGFSKYSFWGLNDWRGLCCYVLSRAAYGANKRSNGFHVSLLLFPLLLLPLLLLPLRLLQ